jgi:hypothetical protein
MRGHLETLIPYRKNMIHNHDHLQKFFWKTPVQNLAVLTDIDMDEKNKRGSPAMCTPLINVYSSVSI